MATSILKEAIVVKKAMAEMAAKFAATDVRVDHTLVGRLGSSALEVVDQLDFCVNMKGFLANVVEPRVDRTLRIFCARKVFKCLLL
jgi:hypothetical protein